MMPIGPLMIEHRLIERLFRAVGEHIAVAALPEALNPDYVSEAVDFMRTYADLCHHGKEEDILFRDLAGKPLDADLRGMMHRLVDEHSWARGQVSRLSKANDRWAKGDMHAGLEVKRLLVQLTDFYPVHIEREDKHFFRPCMDYLAKDEQAAMLREFWEFDRTLIHERYRAIVARLEASQEAL